MVQTQDVQPPSDDHNRSLYETLKGTPFENFVPKCNCGEPNCQVEEIARACSGKDGKGKKLGYEINGMILGLSLIKDASHAAGSCGGPMRAVCGIALTVVQGIATMGDSKDLFNILGTAVINHALVLIDVSKRMEGKDHKLSKQFKSRVVSFFELLEEIKKFVDKMRARNRFKRFILANADLMTLKKLRAQMEDMVSNFQTFLMLEIYCGENQINSAPKSGVEPAQQSRGEVVAAPIPSVREQVKGIMMAELRRQLTQYQEEHNPQPIHISVEESGARVNVQAPLIQFSNAGNVTNPVFYRSGTVTTNNYQNVGNDHSHNTFHIGSLPEDSNLLYPHVSRHRPSRSVESVYRQR